MVNDTHTRRRRSRKADRLIRQLTWRSVFVVSEGHRSYELWHSMTRVLALWHRCSTPSLDSRAAVTSGLQLDKLTAVDILHTILTVLMIARHGDFAIFY